MRPPFDLTKKTPLLTTRDRDETGKKWDGKNESGVRFEKGVKNVEFFRDVRPILDRSCVACHTANGGRKPAGNLMLDDDRMVATQNPAGLGFSITVPGTYARLVRSLSTLDDVARPSRARHREIVAEDQAFESEAATQDVGEPDP